MGYATMLYAVDLDKLKVAVGSSDARLIRRLLPKSTARQNPNDLPRVLVNRKGEIFLNRRLVTLNELVRELRQRKWKGTPLYYCFAQGRHTGRWKDTWSFHNAMLETIPPSQFTNTQLCFSEEELYGGVDEDYELSAEEAAAELVDGRLSRPKMGYQYGYGLEKLCSVLGTFLTSVGGGGGMLGYLRLKTPLQKERHPVPLQKSRSDFPGISYLTAAEVRREVDRVSAIDLSHRDEEIESARREFLEALQKAAKKGLGVVAFYH